MLTFDYEFKILDTKITGRGTVSQKTIELAISEVKSDISEQYKCEAALVTITSIIQAATPATN